MVFFISYQLGILKISSNPLLLGKSVTGKKRYNNRKKNIYVNGKYHS